MRTLSPPVLTVLVVWTTLFGSLRVASASDTAQNDTTLAAFQAASRRVSALSFYATFLSAEAQAKAQAGPGPHRFMVFGGSALTGPVRDSLANYTYAEVDSVGQLTVKFLDGLSFGVDLAKVENVFNIKTSLWDVKQVVDGYDVLDAGASTVMSIAGIVLAFRGGSSASSATQAGGGTLAVAGVANLLRSLLSHSQRSALGDVATKVAISRKAYDDALIRGRTYNTHLSTLDSLSAVLTSTLPILRAAQATQSSKDSAVTTILGCGALVAAEGTALRQTLQDFSAQAHYYAGQAKECTPEVVAGYDSLATVVDGATTRFDRKCAPNFKMIDVLGAQLNGVLVALRQ